MKKLFTLVALAVTIFSYNGVFAQCPLDLSNTTFGFTPTTSSIAQNATETQNIKVYIPGTISSYTIDSVVVTGITGLPAGITYTLTPANGHIVTSSAGGNGEGTICLSGSTSAATGSYPLTFAGTITLSIGTEPLSLVNTVDPTFGDTVVVTAGAPQASCDTMVSLTNAADYLTIYSWQSPSVGFVSGSGAINNSGTNYVQGAIGTEFSGGIGDSVTAAGVFFGYTAIKASDSANLIKVYVLDNTGTAITGESGAPGVAIDSATLTLAEAAASATAGAPAVVEFTHNVQLATTGFYIGVATPTTTGDTIVVVTDTIGQEGNGWLYLSAAGGWISYDSLIGGSLGNYMAAIVCGAPAAPVANFTQSATSGCAPLAVTFTDASTGATGYSWSFGDGSPTSTTQSPSHTYTTAGTYTVTETVTNTSGSATFSSGVTVYATPTATTSVTSSTGSNGDVIVTASGGTSPYTYHWSAGASSTDTLSGLAPGTYTVTVTDHNGCSVTASGTVVTGINTISSDVTIKIYPNPASDQLYFQWSLNAEADIQIYDVVGNIVKGFTVNGTAVSSLDVHDLTAGMYVIRVTDRETNGQRSTMFTKF